MATLTFTAPDGNDSQFELAGELTVGREAGNDVVLPEGGLSRKHARFYDQGGQVFVEDLGSSNGTFVDGQRTEGPTASSDGQDILVANIKVVLSSGAAKAGTPRKQSTAVRKGVGNSARTGQIAKLPDKGAAATPARPGRGGASSPPAKRSGAGAAAEPEAGGARATLKGLTGPWAGKRYALGKAVSVVGRVDANDVAIEDDSVSRRHAEVRKSGTGFIVRDLQSANGTFLNGERVSEAPLRPGDVVKFGVVEFSYSGPAMTVAKGEDSAKKKKLIVGGIAAAGVLVLVGLAFNEAVKPLPNNGSGEDMSKINGKGDTTDIQQVLSLCKSFADPDSNTLDWDRAIQKCDDVLKLDPINVEARKAKKLAEKESAQKKIYDEGHHLVSLGQDEEAMDVFTKLETESIYFRPARAEFIRSAPIAANRAAGVCLTYYKNLEYDRAWPSCKVYGNVSCYLGFSGEDKFKPAFDEVKARNKGKDDWVCPEAYKRFLGGIKVDDLEKDRQTAIKKMYADPDIAMAVINFSTDYIKGQAAIQRYLGKGGKDPALAKKLQQAMDTAFSMHQSGYERILKNDLKGAGVSYKAALETDAKIMPKDWPSNQSKAMRYELSDKYADISKIDFEHNRFPEAYQTCAAGYEFSTSNPAILECLSTLENKATQLLAGGCSDVKMVLKMSRPESLVNKNAQKKLAEQCK
jgi:pSer/pThr/pTyr-binding forkhead associated (FHA) protein